MTKVDHKTKDFLEKIDLLINKGIIKNQAEVVKALRWNKSVMSSVNKGNFPVPQHIYIKFKDLYAEQLDSLLKNKIPEPSFRDDKLIEALEGQISVLKEQNQFLREQMLSLKETVTAIDNKVSEAMQNQLIMAAVQQSFHEFLVESSQGSKAPAVLKKIADKAAASLRKPLKENSAHHSGGVSS